MQPERPIFWRKSGNCNRWSAAINPSDQGEGIRRRGGHNVRLWRFAGVDLTRIDGNEAALTLLEAGLLTAFPSEKHFVSWLWLETTAVSGGNPLPYKKRDGTGSTRVAGVLMAAISLKHSKTALGAAFRRKARHKGWSVAVFSMARIVYRMLRCTLGRPLRSPLPATPPRGPQDQQLVPQVRTG